MNINFFCRESRNGLSLSEAFAAQHPQLVRRSRLVSTRGKPVDQL